MSGRHAQEGLLLYSLGNAEHGKLCQGHFEDESEFEPIPLGPSSRFPSERHNLEPGEIITGMSCSHYVTAVWTSSGRAFIAGRRAEVGLDESVLSRVITSQQQQGLAKLTPLPFPSGQKVRQVACGYHFCLALVDNSVFSWGIGANRQLGYDLKPPSSSSSSSSASSTSSPSVDGIPPGVEILMQQTPRRIETLAREGIRSICAGEATSAAISNDGSLWMWGSNGDWQCAGNEDPSSQANTSNSTLLPFRLDFFGPNNRAAEVALGSATLLRTQDGRVFSWGINQCLGHGGEIQTQRGAREIKQLEDQVIISISCALYHAAAVSALGDVYVWGRGGSRLGLGSDVEGRNVPSKVPGVTNALSVVCTRDFTTVLCDDRRLYIWGRVGGLFPNFKTQIAGLCSPHRLPFRQPAVCGRESPFICLHQASHEHVMVLAYSESPDDRTMALKQLCSFERAHARALQMLFLQYITPIVQSHWTQDSVRSVLSSCLNVFLLRHHRDRVACLYNCFINDWFQWLPKDRLLSLSLMPLSEASYANFFENFSSSLPLSLRQIMSDPNYFNALEQIFYRRCHEVDIPPPYALPRIFPDPVGPPSRFFTQLHMQNHPPAAPLPVPLPSLSPSSSFASSPSSSSSSFHHHHHHVADYSRSSLPFLSIPRQTVATVPHLPQLFAEVFPYPTRLLTLLQAMLEATPSSHRDTAALRRTIESLSRINKNLQSRADPRMQDDAWSRMTTKYRYCRQFDRVFRARDAVYSDRAFVNRRFESLLVAFSDELLIVGDSNELLLSSPLEYLWIEERLTTSSAPTNASSLVLRTLDDQMIELFAPMSTLQNWSNDIASLIDKRLKEKSFSDPVSVISRVELHIYSSSFHRHIVPCNPNAEIEQVVISSGGGVAVLCSGAVYLFEHPTRSCNVAPRLLTFADVPRPQEIARLFAGKQTIVAVSKAGELWEANWISEKHEITARRATWLPRRLKPTDIVEVSYGAAHWGFVTTSGRVYVCGSNGHGALGLGGGDVATPTKLSFPRVDGRSTKIRRLRLGLFHSIAVSEAGNVFCWGGDGISPVLGLGATVRMASTPTLLSAFGHLKIIDAACGDTHSCFLADSGDVYICGPSSMIGTLLPPASAWDPVHVSSLTEPIESISCGSTHTLAVSRRGVVYTWGSKDVFGQMARGGSPQLPAPIELSCDFTSPLVMACSLNTVTAVLQRKFSRKLRVRLPRFRLDPLAWWTDAIRVDALEDTPILPIANPEQSVLGFVGAVEEVGDGVARPCTIFPPFSFSINSLKGRAERKIRTPMLISFDENLADFQEEIRKAAVELGVDIPESLLLWFEVTKEQNKPRTSRTFFVTPTLNSKINLTEQTARMPFFSRRPTLLSQLSARATST